MKLLIILSALLINIVAFAQTSEQIENFVCDSGESCLIDPTDGWVIKSITIENRRGEVVGAKLSSFSHITDTAYPGASLCFRGKPQMVCKLLKMMSFEGSHVVIESLNCAATESSIDIEYLAKYDMAPQYEVTKMSIPACL